MNKILLTFLIAVTMGQVVLADCPDGHTRCKDGTEHPVPKWWSLFKGCQGKDGRRAEDICKDHGGVAEEVAGGGVLGVMQNSFKTAGNLINQADQYAEKLGQFANNPEFKNIFNTFGKFAKIP